METHAFGFRLPTNAPEGKAISYQLNIAVLGRESSERMG